MSLILALLLANKTAVALPTSEAPVITTTCPDFFRC